MALFQQSVLKKYVANIDNTVLQSAWQLYQGHFFNTEIQRNIRDSKEEEYQEGFVRDLFVNVLGYTLNPQPAYNFVLEKKTVTDATKSDGAILLKGNVIGVVELKDTGTPDLDKVSNQAFGYKNKHKNCIYVITSNFEKLRFYINDATDFEEFNLFTLSQESFAVLYLCLQQQNLLSDVPLKIKQQSLVQEENVTKKLYADYSIFKRKLFQNIAEQNPQHDKLLLFKKTQKLLDRLLFIFFAEDRLLLPPNSVREILKQWEQLKELDNYVSLYNRFKKYFGYLNVGHVGKQHEIFAYNGGLFLPDEVLDSITIDDSILFTGAMDLSKYDYETEVDVNILGHIFEHSLTEIEELQLELEGKPVEKNKTKRKKEGVFYTPRFITKYIVENTVGALCTQKKEELEINEDTFAPQKRKANRKDLLDKIEVYRKWLLNLTICDPACGSGAFLNAALEYLKAEHRTLDELTAKVHDTPMVFPEMDNEILENNLFGVDINEDAIEIAKLSLWLHTAKRGRKLSNLSNNIKCGNSLIDDPAFAGEKAFKWREEFPQVFDNGGFDVVIGNPPYATKIFTVVEMRFYKQNYKAVQYQLDLYLLFIENSLNILKEKIGLITPNSWLKNMTMSPIRLLLLNNIHFNSIVINLANVFEDASVDSLIFIGSKENNLAPTIIQTLVNKQFVNKHTVNQSKYLNNENYVFTVEANDAINIVLEKMNASSASLKDFFDITRGVNPYDSYRGQSKEVISTKAYHADYKKDDTFIPEIRGKHMDRYFYKWDKKSYISYGNWLAAAREAKYFKGERIIFRQVLGERLICTVIEEPIIIDQSIFIALPKENSPVSPKYVITLLASKLGATYFKFSSNEFDAIFPKIKLGEFNELPVKVISHDQQQPFIEKAAIMLQKNKDLNDITQSFTQLVQTKYPVININNKLQKWHSLATTEFLKELAKQKIKLSLSEQQEWLQYFEEQKAKANAIQQIIKQTDASIDAMVYQLYGLTEEEIKIVEGKVDNKTMEKN